MLRVDPPALTPVRKRGSASTLPSTAKKPTLPNCVELTFASVRVVSCALRPSRELLSWKVVISGTVAVGEGVGVGVGVGGGSDGGVVECEPPQEIRKTIQESAMRGYFNGGL